MVINRACNIGSLCRPSNRADARLCDAGLIGHDRKTNVRPIVFRRDFEPSAVVGRRQAHTIRRKCAIDRVDDIVNSLACAQ